MINDPIGDLLTRIRNGQAARLVAVKSPHSKQRVRVLEVLKREGYIREYKEETENGHKVLVVELKYAEGKPAIVKMNRVSRPGRRVYSPIKDVGLVYNGLGIAILSTPRGVMSDKEARDANVGGEVLCHVF